jgi:hypothetical protein
MAACGWRNPAVRSFAVNLIRAVQVAALVDFARHSFLLRGADTIFRKWIPVLMPLTPNLFASVTLNSLLAQSHGENSFEFSHWDSPLPSREQLLPSWIMANGYGARGSDLAS